MNEAAPSFAVIKLSSLGDIVQTIPAILHCKRAVPNLSITWIVDEDAKPLVEAFHVADTVIGIPFKRWKDGKCSTRELLRALLNLRKRSYTVFCDFQGNVKSLFVRSFLTAKKRCGYAFSDAPERIASLFLQRRIRVDVKNVYWRYIILACRSLEIHIPDAIPTCNREMDGNGVYVAPFSRWDAKTVPASFWMEAVHHFEVLAGPSDNTSAFAKHVVHKGLSFHHLIERVKRAQVVYGVDSFVIHLAAVLGVPTRVFFSASSGTYYAPPNGLVAQGGCPLKISFSKRCPHLRTCQNKGCKKELRPFLSLFH